MNEENQPLTFPKNGICYERILLYTNFSNRFLACFEKFGDLCSRAKTICFG